MTSTPALFGGGRSARVIFFGSGAFAVPILEALVALPGLDIVAVVVPPDRPAGRRAELARVPVAARAAALGLPVRHVARVRAPEAIAFIAALHPDLGILADFGQIIPPAILQLPGHGILNIHPSILPRHRGATPIAAAILAGDEEAGVTVMQMDAGLDSGPVVAVRRWRLLGGEDAPAIEAQAASAGARLLEEVLPSVLAGRAVATPQDPLGATMTRPLRRSDGRLDPSLPAALLERQVRAFRPWPGTHVEVGGLRLAVLEAAVGPAARDDRPGTLVGDNGGLAIATPAGRLRLGIVQPAGGRRMTGAAFRRGRPDLVGSAIGGARGA